ncbi:hypothetical protein HZY62_13935 [Maribacter polysiphoniae]|uniref:SpoIIAA-like protein n=1 Tax=Maribacter polysiphoniae TaxID=429344 RepID=A0A316DWS3_9FLAO|nr:hypothetical protein [Maribacter polysiphoniae]MBD1261700.1 hypothetical protein [Maribacter polysiphoniae]PWK22494.1 hypothetical protein LX92_02968 [Maribacter polysiphoniae]
MYTKFTKESDFLYVDVNGSFALDAFLETLIKIGSEVEDKVIIDGSYLENTDISYEIRYELVIAAQKFLNAGTKYAVIWPPKDVNNFIMINLNRFGITIEVFPNLVKAKKWLKIPS